MYKRIWILFIAAAVALTACEQDDAAKLQELKKQKQEIEKQIAELEKKVGPDTTNVREATPVAITIAVPDTFKHYIEVQGTVESDNNVFVTSSAMGAIVTEVNVSEGDRVQKGQVLARLDAGAIDQQIQDAKNKLELATTLYNKQKNLWDQKIGTEVQYLQAKSNMESAQRGLAGLREQYSNFVLKSPINGTVDDVSLKIGEVPVAGKNGIRVVNPEDVRVEAQLSEAYINKVKQGDKVIVEFPNQGTSFSSKIKTAGKVIDPANRSFSIVVEPNKKADVVLRPNMISVVKINDYTNNSVITLPVNVVQKDDQGSFVYVVVDGENGTEVSKKPVELGLTYNGRVEILDGLDKGDRVISAGYQNVTDGQQVAL